MSRKILFFVLMISLVLVTVVVPTVMAQTTPNTGDTCSTVARVGVYASGASNPSSELPIGTSVTISDVRGIWALTEFGWIPWTNNSRSAFTLSNCHPIYLAATATPSSGRNAVDVVVTEDPGSGGGGDANAQSVETSTPLCIDKVRTYDAPVNAPSNYTTIMEVGGVGSQMVEQYIAIVGQTIVFLVNPLEPNVSAARWDGLGGAWETTQLAGCETFDLIQNARTYVADRASRNEAVSGLVVDLRGTEPVLVYNYSNLTPAEIQTRLAEFATHQGSNPPNYANLVYAANSQSICVNESHAPVVNDPWEMGCTNMYAVVGFWTNWPGHDQAERKVLLNPGFYTLNGGGDVRFFSTLEAAQAAYDTTGYPAVTLQTLINEGLAQIGLQG